MMKGEHKTTLQGASVFVVQAFFPPYRDSHKQHTPGHWAVIYAWGYVSPHESMNEEARKRLTILREKAQSYNGTPGQLNLHYNSLAYLKRADAHAAVAKIRKWKSCKYKVRVVRETVWREVVIDDYPKESLERPFYWPPGSAGDRMDLDAVKCKALHIVKGQGRVQAIKFIRGEHPTSLSLPDAMDLLAQWERRK